MYKLIITCQQQQQQKIESVDNQGIWNPKFRFRLIWNLCSESMMSFVNLHTNYSVGTLVKLGVFSLNVLGTICYLNMTLFIDRVRWDRLWFLEEKKSCRKGFVCYIFSYYAFTTGRNKTERLFLKIYGSDWRN